MSYAAHVGVGNLTSHPHFGVKLCEPRGIAVDVRRQKLQRDRLTELEIVCPVHFPHSAFTPALDDAIAAAEERAGPEAPVIDSARAREPAVRRGGGASPIR
jgi:hypothetical protein